MSFTKGRTIYDPRFDKIGAKPDRKLRKLRKALNLTQRQLGEALGYTEKGYAALEQGYREAGVDIFKKIKILFPNT